MITLRSCNCNGSGYKTLEDGSQTWCVCAWYKRAIYHYQNSGAPALYMKFLQELEDTVVISDQTGEKIDVKQLLLQYDGKVLETFIKNNGRIILEGLKGTGKTQAACSLMLHAMKRGYKGKYLDVRMLSIITFQSEKKIELLDGLKGKDILILDDLTAEKKVEDNGTVYTDQLLDTIIRNFEGLIILTTNTEQAEREYAKDERLQSALFTGDVYTYGFVGENKRLKSKIRLEGLR